MANENDIGFEIKGKAKVEIDERQITTEARKAGNIVTKEFEKGFHKAVHTLYTRLTPRDTLLQARDRLTPSQSTYDLATRNLREDRSARERIAIKEAREQISAYKVINSLIREQDSDLQKHANILKDSTISVETAAKKNEDLTNNIKERESARADTAERSYLAKGILEEEKQKTEEIKKQVAALKVSLEQERQGTAEINSQVAAFKVALEQDKLKTAEQNEHVALAKAVLEREKQGTAEIGRQAAALKVELEQGRQITAESKKQLEAQKAETAERTNIAKAIYEEEKQNTVEANKRLVAERAETAERTAAAKVLQEQERQNTAEAQKRLSAQKAETTERQAAVKIALEGEKRVTAQKLAGVKFDQKAKEYALKEGHNEREQNRRQAGKDADEERRQKARAADSERRQAERDITREKDKQYKLELEAAKIALRGAEWDRRRAEMQRLRKETDDTAKSTNKFSAALKKLGSAVKSKLGDSIKGLLSKSVGKIKSLLSQFRRMFKYRVLRNIISKILNLVKEGFTNLNDYSRVLGTPFHTNVQRLASSLNYLKNAFAAMVAPVINYVTPALERLMDTIAMLANRVGAFFAALTGQTQFSAALKKTVSDATSAAGKMKDLFGFDDLNRLSGESGGGNDLEYAFEEWDPNGGFFGQIKSMVESGEWEEIGSTLAGKLNGLVSGFNAEDLGSKIADKINGAVKIAKGFITETNFTEIGNKIAGFVNGLMKIDTADIATTLTRSITGLFDIGLGFISTLNWSALGSSIGTFVSTTLKNLSTWINEQDWETAGSNLVNGLCDAIEGLGVDDILDSLGDFLSALIEGAVNLALGLLKAAWNRIVAPEIAALLEKIPDVVFTELGTTKEGAIASLYFDIKPKLDKNATNEAKTDLKNFKDSNSPIPVGVKLDKNSTKQTTKDIDDAKRNYEKTSDPVKVATTAEPIKPSLWQVLKIKMENDLGKSPIGLPFKLAADVKKNGGLVKSIDDAWEWIKGIFDKKTITPKVGEAKNISEVKSKAQATANRLSPITYLSSLKDPTNISAIKKAAQDSANAKGPLYFAMSIATSNLMSSLAYVWGVMQRSLYDNPLNMPTIVSSGQPETFSGKSRIANTKMASGGSVPNVGSLILAGEAGPEIVANMGNRTGVMNVDQMESAVANGNVDVVNAVYAMANMIVSAVNAKDLDVYMDSAKVGQSVSNYQNNQMRRGVAY